MAKEIKVLSQFGGQQVASPFPVTVPVFAGAISSIKKGMLVYTDGGHAGYWKAGADAATTTQLINGGVATSDSTDTAAANGEVTIDVAPVMLVSLKAKTPANLTAAMRGVAFILDVTGSDYTMDQGTSVNGILNLIDYDNTTDGNCICALTTHWRG